MTMHPSNKKEMQEAILALRAAGDALEGSHTAAMMKIESAWATFAEAVIAAIAATDTEREAYNEAFGAARSAVEDATSELGERLDARSDTWKDSPKGVEATDQIEGMEAFTSGSEYNDVEAFTLTSLPDVDADGPPDLDADAMPLGEIVTSTSDLGGAL